MILPNIAVVSQRDKKEARKKSISKHIYKCQVCGKEFRDYPSRKRKYCSQKCMGKAYRVERKGISYGYHRIVDEKQCPICGKSFYPKITHRDGKRQKFCSVECAKQYVKNHSNGYTITKICPTCKKQFIVKKKGKKNADKRLYCCRACFYNRTKGIPKISKDGYIKIYVGKDYLGASPKGLIYKHRLVMQKHLGRKLETWEQVHHINGNKKDNRIENLELVLPTSHTTYTLMQKEIRKLRAEIVRLNKLLNKTL